MQISLDFFILLIIFLGIIQGFFLGFVFFKKAQKKSNLLFALILFCISGSIFSSFLILTNLFKHIPFFIRFEWVLLFIHPALLFLYTKSLTEENFLFSKKNFLYFIPSLLCFIILTPFFMSDNSVKIQYIIDIINIKYYPLDIFLFIYLVIVELAFIFRIYVLIIKHQNKIKENFSTIEKINLNWIFLYSSMYLFTIVLSIILIIIIFIFNYSYIIIYKFLPIFVSGAIIYLGYRGLIQNNIYNIDTPVYKNIKVVSDIKSKEYYNKLINLLNNDKLYLNSNLSIIHLCNKLSISTGELAQIIFENTGKKIHDFIDYYKAEQFENILNDNKVEISNKSKMFHKDNKKIKMNKKSQLKIGLFLVSYHDYYESSIYSGIKKVFEEEGGVKLFCFLGGDLNSPYYNYSQKNFLYDLVSPEHLDGIIMISSSIGNYISKDELRTFINHYSSIPIINIGIDMENIPSIIVNNENGMRDLMIHLLEVHKFNQIAFIKGPESSSDAQIRFNIFKEMLLKYNVPINEQLIVPGTFTGESGKKAIQILLDQRKVNFQALVSSNDFMAIQAIHELEERGIKVPEDIVVVGFDGAKEGQQLVKPLTTVCQPSFEVGYQSAKMLLKIINEECNKEIINKMILPSRLLVKKTCGCDLEKFEQLNLRKSNTIIDNDFSIDEIIEIIKKDVKNFIYFKFYDFINESEINKWTTNLLKSLLLSMDNIANENFNKCLEKIILESLENKIDIYLWHDIISYIFNKINYYLVDENSIEFFNDLYKKAKIFIENQIIKHKNPIKNNDKDLISILFSITQVLESVVEIDKFKNVLINELPKYHINTCYISLYDEETKNISLNVLGYKKYKNNNIIKNEEKFLSTKFIPEGLDFLEEEKTYNILPLYYKDEQLGTALFGGEKAEIKLYELLAMQISNTLKEIKLLNKIQEQNTTKSKKENRIDIFKQRKIDQKKSEEYFNKLKNFVINEQIYKNPDINIQSLAKKLGITQSNLSFIINKYTKNSFFEFMNSFRVEEAKKHLINFNSNFNIYDIAYKSGFKSTVLFNKIFKNHTKMSPFQYRLMYSSSKIKDNHQPCFGVFIESLYDNFNILILSGISKFVQENNINLICFNGGEINSPYYNYKQKSIIYELANKKNIDGIISLSVILGTYVLKEELIKFYGKYIDIPVISIGMELEGYPSISIDNKKGMCDLLNHLIKDHGYKKIAFIKGPENNLDAEIRFKIYKEILQENNIKFNPDLVVPGNFIGISGREAVSILLDKRKVEMDAIVSANDYMAIYASQELQNRGYRIPEDIAIVGFDDIIESKFLSSPLTTVTQPAFELGYQAGKILYSILKGDKFNHDLMLKTGLVIRESCGCKINHDIDMENKIIITKGKNTLLTLDNIKKEILADVINLLETKFGGLINKLKVENWFNLLIDFLISDINNEKDDKFINHFNGIINESLNYRIDIYFWRISMSNLFSKMYSIYGIKSKINFIDKIYTNIKEIIKALENKIKEYPVLKNYDQAMKLYLVNQALLSISEIDILKSVLLKELPLLGIKSFFLSIYDTNDNNRQYSRIIVAYKNYKEINYKKENEFFISFDLIPDTLRNMGFGNTYIAMSLYYENTQIGFVIYESDDVDISLFEILTMSLNNALRGIILHNKSIYHNKENKSINKDTIEKYQKSGLPNEKAEEYFKELINYMEREKVYINPDLTLPNLAEEIKISRNHLSYIINKYAGLNFYDFINTYRIEEAKRIILNMQDLNMNILDVAFYSGFKSKSTFNKIFKKYTNKTPSDFKKENIKV